MRFSLTSGGTKNAGQVSSLHHGKNVGHEYFVLLVHLGVLALERSGDLLHIDHSLEWLWGADRPFNLSSVASAEDQRRTKS